MIMENSVALPYITNTQIIQLNHISSLIITFTRGFGVLGYCLDFEPHSERSSAHMQKGAQATKDFDQQTDCAQA